jgi:glycosyltransferase involved in cell wall biosynthesis
MIRPATAVVDNNVSSSVAQSARTRAARVAVICDLKEENWPSMDLVGEMLLENLRINHANSISAERVCPSMRRRFTHSASANGNRSELSVRSKHIGNAAARIIESESTRFNADRLINRFWDYPRYLKSIKGRFDLFHIVDHSYSQLALELPGNRVIIACHDIDSFRCLTNPLGDRRGRMFKAMAKRILEGFRKAARVTCDSQATRDEVIENGLIAPEKVAVIHNGVHPSCSVEPDAQADEEARRLLGPPRNDSVDILHVGSSIKRKRIDVLLKVFANLRKEFPQARLIRVGGEFTAEQSELAKQLKLGGAIVILPFLERNILAAVYRRAALALQPSDGEGFGLPVIEAMACGLPVAASDISVLKEVGGDAAVYCPVANVSAWSEQVIALIRERACNPNHWAARRATGLAQAAKFSWAAYAESVARLYQEILNPNFETKERAK